MIWHQHFTPTPKEDHMMQSSLPLAHRFPFVPRRWSRVLAGAAVALTLVSSAPGEASPYNPELPPVQIVHVDTDTNPNDTTTFSGTVLYANTAAPTAGEPEGWWVRGDVYLHNYGGLPLTLRGFSLDTDVSGPVYADYGGTADTLIPPGDIVGFGAHRITGSGPKPTVLTVLALTDEYLYPVSLQVPLVEYENATPTGGYRFPARAGDLPADTYWALTRFHNMSKKQRYGYDLGARRKRYVTEEYGGWVWTKYTNLAYQDAEDGIEMGSRNDHFAAWDLPVYAMADGVVVKCHRTAPDNTPGETSSQGNGVTIDHNGEWVHYAHLRENTVPLAVCPDEDNIVPVPITAGQYLGRVGNSGSSSGPHLHLHGQEDSLTNGRALPLRFHSIEVRPYSNNPEDDGVFEQNWSYVSPNAPAALSADPPLLIYPIDEPSGELEPSGDLRRLGGHRQPSGELEPTGDLQSRN